MAIRICIKPNKRCFSVWGHIAAPTVGVLIRQIYICTPQPVQCNTCHLKASHWPFCSAWVRDVFLFLTHQSCSKIMRYRQKHCTRLTKSTICFSADSKKNSYGFANFLTPWCMNLLLKHSLLSQIEVNLDSFLWCLSHRGGTKLVSSEPLICWISVIVLS